MKKSKIIVPALGILAFSTAAAVTGTVAWFTANRLATVSNTKITVVNPEAGLNVQATNVANTTVSNDGSTNHLPAVTHGLVSEKQGYLRDASVKMGAAPVVYRSVLDDSGALSEYKEQNIATADTNTYNGAAVYFATQFKLEFWVDRIETGYDTCLFFDANASSVVSTDLQNVYKSVRFGIQCGTNWAVWAPLTADTGTSPAQAIKNVTGEGSAAAGANVADVDAAHRIIGNDAADDTSDDLNDSQNLVVKANKKVSDEYAYLGDLGLTANKITVNVYTWFEGTDSACVNANFSSIQDTFTSSMTFISRKVSKTA